MSWKNEPDLFHLSQTLRAKVLIYNSALKTKKITTVTQTTYFSYLLLTKKMRDVIPIFDFLNTSITLSYRSIIFFKGYDKHFDKSV